MPAPLESVSSVLRESRLALLTAIVLSGSLEFFGCSTRSDQRRALPSPTESPVPVTGSEDLVKVTGSEFIRLLALKAVHSNVAGDPHGFGTARRPDDGGDLEPVGEWSVCFGKTDVPQRVYHFSTTGGFLGVTVFSPDGSLTFQEIDAEVEDPPGSILLRDPVDPSLIRRPPWLWGMESHGLRTKDVSSVYYLVVSDHVPTCLDGLDLTGGSIAGSTFDTCDFGTSNFRGTDFSGVTFLECDLSRVEGLTVKQLLQAERWGRETVFPSPIQDLLREFDVEEYWRRLSRDSSASLHQEIEVAARRADLWD